MPSLVPEPHHPSTQIYSIQTSCSEFEHDHCTLSMHICAATMRSGLFMHWPNRAATQRQLDIST